MIRPFARCATLVAVCCVVGGPSAFAEPPRGTAPAAPSGLYLDWLSGWNVGPSAGDHYRIGLDPETGEWGRAPVDQALEVSGLVAEPLVIHRADGSIEVIVDPRVVEYVVARLGPGGRPAFDCVPKETVGTALSAPAVSGAPDR